jgi:hypothetical protein
MVTCTEHWRLCYSSMSIWKLNFISFMRLFLAPLVRVHASRGCTDEARPIGTRRWFYKQLDDDL